jgi:hypothetical protein
MSLSKNPKVQPMSALNHSNSEGQKNPNSKKNPAAGGGVRSASSLHSPAVGNVAEGGQAPQEEPPCKFAQAIVSCIMTSAKKHGAKVNFKDVTQYANTHASGMPEKMRKFVQGDVDQALLVFREQWQQQQEQRQQEQQQRQQQQQQRQQQQQQRQQQQQQQEQQRQQRQQEQQQQQPQQQQQQQPPKPPKPIKQHPPERGSLQLVKPPPKRKEHKGLGELPKANPDSGTAYGRVLRAKGDCRFDVEDISTGTVYRGCRLRGSFPRDTRVKPDDIVLLLEMRCESTSTVQTPGWIIVYRYEPAEIRTLQKMGELTERCSAHLHTSSVCFVSTAPADEFDFEEKWGGRELPFPSDSEDDDSEDDA